MVVFYFVELKELIHINIEFVKIKKKLVIKLSSNDFENISWII